MRGQGPYKDQRPDIELTTTQPKPHGGQGLKARPKQTHGGQGLEARPRRTYGGHMADTWRAHGGQAPGTRPEQAPGTRPEHIAASPFFLRESLTANCLGEKKILKKTYTVEDVLKGGGGVCSTHLLSIYLQWTRGAEWYG